MSDALIQFVWQGAAVALLLWVVQFVLRRRSAQSRYLAGCAALAIMAILPAVTAFFSYRQAGVGMGRPDNDAAGLGCWRHDFLASAALELNAHLCPALPRHCAGGIDL